MAYSADRMAPVGNTSKPLSGVGAAGLYGAPTIWTYATADAKNTVTATGYFNNASKLLKVGDVILIFTGAGSGGTQAWAWVAVNSNTGGVVDVNDGVVITATDTY